MGQLLREYRRVYPNDTRSDLSILELYRDQLGEEKFRQYKEDYDSYINEVNKLVPLGIGEEFSRGFTRGYEGLKGTAKGAAALALGKLIPGDQEETEDRLLASARENFQKASRPELSSTGQGALQGYAAGAGEVLPSLLEAGVTATAGAIAGAAIVPAPDPADAVTVPAGFLTGLFSKSAVKNAIKENITLRLGKEATKEGVEKKYKDIVKEETTEALESAARSLNITDVAFAAEKRKIVSQTLGVAVTGLNSIGLSSGEIYNQLRSDPDIDRDTAMNYALAGGVAAGVAEAAMPAMILTKAVRSVGSTKIRPYDVDGVYSKIVNSFPGKLAKNLGGSMAVEGGTEAYQSWVSIVTQKAAKGMTLGEAIDAPLSYEEEKEIAHAFKLGLIAGSLGGGVSLGIDALTGNEAIEYIDQIERTEEEQARAEIPLSMAKLTNEEMEQLDELALRFAVSMEVRQETEEGESIIIGIQRAAVDSELYNEEIKPLLDSSPTKAKYFSNRMVDLRAKIKLAIKENEERVEAARVEAEKQRADSGLPQMTVEQKFEALNNALAATQEERDARADLEARAGGIDPVVEPGVTDIELKLLEADLEYYERIDPEDSKEVQDDVNQLVKLNEEFEKSYTEADEAERKKLVKEWRKQSDKLFRSIDKGRAEQGKAEAKREADKKKAEAAEEKRKKKEEELTVKPKTVEENNNQLKLNVGNRSAQRADELALIGKAVKERAEKAAKRAFEGINTDTKKVEEIPDEVISAAVEEAYNDKDSTLIPQKDEDGNDLPIPEVKDLSRQEIIDVLEEYSTFTQVALKKADYESKADLFQKKKNQAAKIEKVLEQIDAGEVSGLPEDLIAFQTQPGDERRVEFDNLGNPKAPEDQSMSYPAYYEAEGNLIASDKFRIAVQAAYEAIEKSGDSVADVKLLGELLKSETFDKAPKGSEGKTTMLTRMVVLKDTRDDAPKDAKYQIVTITKSSAKQNYRVGIPVGVIKEKKNTVNIGLDEAMRMGFEPVASIRMTVPVDGLTYTMSEQEFESMSQRLNQRRVDEADRAVIDDTADTKSVENISKDVGAATQAQKEEEGGEAPDLIADVTSQEEKTFTEEGEEVPLDRQIADAEKEEDEAADALLAALDKMNLGVERLDLVREAVIIAEKDGRETNLPVINQDFPDFIDRYVKLPENRDLPAEEVFHKLFMDELGSDFIGRDKVDDPGMADEASLVSAADLAQEAIDEYIRATKDAGLEINLQEAATLVYGLASNEINESIQNVQQHKKNREQADNKQGQATDDGATQSTVDVARKSAEAQQVAQAEGENVTEVEDDGTVHYREISLETIDVVGEYAIEHLVNMSLEELEISQANFRNEVEDIVSGSLSSTLARGRKLTRWRKMLDASQDRSEALFDGEGLEGITYSDNLPTQAQKDEVLRRLMQELRADSEVKAMPDGMGENITDKTVFDVLEAYEAFVDRSEGIGTLALMDRLGISEEEATGVFEAVLNFKDAGESRVGVAIGEQAAKLAGGYETAIDLEFARREADLLKDPASVQELFRKQDVGVHGTDSETALKILSEPEESVPSGKKVVRIFAGSHYDIASKDTGQSLTYSVRFVFPADEIRKGSTEKQYRPGEFVSRSQVVAEPVAIIIDNGLDDTTEGLAEVKALAESKGIKVFEKESVFLRRGDPVGGRVKEVSLYYESVLRKQDSPEEARRKQRQLEEEIKQQRNDFDAELAAWISGEGPMPSEPKYIYRGLSYLSDFTEGHGSPWLDVAAVAGKLGGSPGAHDIYRYYDSGNRLYYRGGALVGPESVLERTRIDSTYGMTWEQVMQEAKGLFTEFLSKDEGSYDESGVSMDNIDGGKMQGLRFDQLSKKAKDRVLYYAVGSVKLDIKHATFEVATDTLNREAEAVAPPIPYAQRVSWRNDPANPMKNPGSMVNLVASQALAISGARNARGQVGVGDVRVERYGPETGDLGGRVAGVQVNATAPSAPNLAVRDLIYELLPKGSLPSDVRVDAMEGEIGKTFNIDQEAKVELLPAMDSKTVRINRILSVKKGGAIKVLRKLARAADVAGVTLTGTAQSFGQDGLSDVELERFYSLLGADVDENGNVVREPRGTLNREAGTEGTSDSILNDKRLGETPDDVMQFFEDEAGESIVDMLKLLQRLDTQEVPASEGGPMSAQTAQMLAKGSIDSTQVGVIERNRRAILDAVTSLLIKSPVLSESGDGAPIDPMTERPINVATLRLRRRTNRRKSDREDSGTLGGWNSGFGRMDIFLENHKSIGELRQTVVHEAFHVLFSTEIDNYLDSRTDSKTPFMEEVAQLDKIFQTYRELWAAKFSLDVDWSDQKQVNDLYAANKIPYAFTDLHEFISEAVSNSQIQTTLSGLSRGGTSAIKAAGIEFNTEENKAMEGLWGQVVSSLRNLALKILDKLGLGNSGLKVDGITDTDLGTVLDIIITGSTKLKRMSGRRGIGGMALDGRKGDGRMYYRQTNLMDPTPDISTDIDVSSTKSAQRNVAAQNLVKDTFRGLYEEYNKLGLNIEELSYEDFVKRNLGVSTTPESVIENLNAALVANGMAAVDPDYSVDDVTEKETVRSDAYRYLKKIEDRLNRKASKALLEATELREKAREDAEDFESLRIRYDEITTLTKAVEKEIRNNLRKARNDGVELTDIQRSVRDELAPKAYKDASGKRVKPMGRTGEILQAVGKRMEALGIDFSDSSVSPDDLVTAMLGDRAIASSIQSIFPDSFQKQEEAARIMVELGRSNRYLFDYAALASDSSLASERGIVNDILAEAVKPDSKAMERARAMLSRLTKSAKTAGHLLNNVQTARNKHTASNKKLQTALDRIEVRDSIGPNLSDRLSLMEETLGVEWRVEALVGDEEGGDQQRIDTLFVAVEGAEYRVPSSPEQSSSSLYKSDPVVFTSAPRTSDLIEEDLRDPEKYRAKLKADLYKIHAWLNHEGRIKDAGYNYMKRVYDQLSSQVTVGDYLDGQAGFVSKLIGTLKDEIEATGSPIMQSLVRRLTRYVADSERVRNLEALSDSWAVAENEAISIFYPKGEMRDKESFRVNVYETALSFFENNQQILEENDSVEEAIEAAFVKLEAHLRKGHGDVSKTLQSNPQAFPALKRLLQATGDMSEAIMQQQEEMGIKVKDGTYFRKAVGAKLFTVSRSLSPKILATVINMRRDGWTKKFENIAQRYTEALGDPAKMEELKAEISSKFKSDTVVANFLRPIMDIPGLTQFKSAGGAIAEDSNANMQYSLVAESNDVAEAYKMSGSETDIIAFAENLYQLTGGDPSNEESRAAYVEDVLAKLDNLFSGLNRSADEHYNPESAKGDFGTGIGRPMMDARSSSGYPSEWLEYSTYEEQSVHITIRALAANAAFGERLRGFKRDIEASELAFKEQINRLQELISGGLSESEIRDILNKEYGPGGYNAVKNARKNLEMVDKVNKNITSLIANDAKIYDFRTFYEVLGTFSGLVVQNIKTGLIDLSSLFAMPFTNYGFTRKGFQQFFKGFNIFKEPIGSLLQIFGTQIDMDAGLQADYTRVMVGDPDAQRDLTTRIKAAWARDVPGLDPVNPGPTRYIAKAARALQEIIGTGIRGAGSQTSQVRYATFKPLAPFTMIGQWMVATNTKNMWSTMTKLAQEGADYMRSNPDSARNPNFTFSHKNFKGMSEEAFNYMVEALNDSGMSLETLSERILLEEAAGSRPQIFTDSELRLLAIKAQEDVTKETSPLTRPSWVFTSALGRASNPLVGWSVEKFADVARKFKTKDELGNISKAAMVRSLLPYMGVLPVSLAFTFMRKEWEEEVVGKRPNILEFDYENHGLYNGVFLPALDQTNRAGTFGIAGDLVNSTFNKSTAREFNVENRVFFLSMLKGLVRTSHTLAVQGSDGLDYNNTYRPLIQTLGGSGYLETSQILTRMFGISTPETTTTKRLNVENWLRVVGRPMVNQGVVVKKPSGLVSQPNKIKPHISNMRHAAISNDSQWFMQETNAAIQAYMKLNPLDSREDAEKKIKSMYSDYHPMRRVFTRLPNEEQYEEIINSVPEEHREEIRSALDLYNSFGETIGVTPFRGKAERGSGGSGRRRSATSSREAILRRLMGGGSSSYYGGNRGNAATSRNDILRKALGY